MADTQVSSEYIGWVNLSVTELVKRWRKQKNNHGVLITVEDVDDVPWDAPRIFVTMDCTTGVCVCVYCTYIAIYIAVVFSYSFSIFYYYYYNYYYYLYYINNLLFIL